jgi:gliding motility-associated-like protein
MKINNNTFFYLLSVFLFNYTISYTQTDELWSEETSTSLLLFQKNAKQSLHKKERICRLNLPLLKQKLQESHYSSLSRKSKKSKLRIPFPDKNGILKNYIVSEASIFSAELQLKHPNIRSYVGVSDDSLKTMVRFSMSNLGLNLMKFSNDGNSEFIDPYTKDALTYVIYSKKDLPTDMQKSICNVIEKEQNKQSKKSTKLSRANASNGNLRTFRLALSCTGEYAKFHLNDQNIAPSATDAIKKAAVLAAMNISMTRVNGVFEKEVALTMQLVANNETLIFLDPATDGYTSNDDFKMIDESQTKCNALIGTANYDIGHLFNTGFSGLAELSSPCRSNAKASAVSGRDPVKGDSFDIDFVAHEMGHQFGATHTFNNSCNSNISASTSVEPGSGTTIMGYAGICSPDIQENSDAYFHGVSIEQIYNNITNGNSTCAEQTSIGKSPPTADAGNNYTIPISTPFALKGTATNDTGSLTYCWEQTDTQQSTMPPLSTSSAGPLFRSLPPTSSAERHFPNLQTTLIGEIGSTWEKLPSVAREIDFKLTVRDNEVPTGQFATDNTKVLVSDISGPFKITSQNTPETFNVGESKTITWNVAGTDSAPIKTSFVNILLSTDGGITYPTLLAENVLNNGSQSVIIPNKTTTSGRVKVEAVDNIYYSINEENITILASNFVMIFEENSTSSCAPSDATYRFEYNTFLGFNEEITFSITGIPEGTIAVFSPTTATVDGTLVTLTISDIIPVMQGAHTPVVTGTTTSEEKSINLSLLVDNYIETEPFLSYPQNNANSLATSIDFTWESETTTNSFSIEIATDIEFLNIIEFGTTRLQTYTAKNFSENETYYWRVKETNTCNTGENSLIYKFQIGSIEEFSFNQDEVIEIPDNDSSGISSIITIDEAIYISDISISLNITHSYAGDLKISLKNPIGQEITLIENSDKEGENFTNTTFEDKATTSIMEGSAPFSGSFKPKDPLATYADTESLGDWRLTIIDVVEEDTGSLLNWKITINGIDHSSLASGVIPNQTIPKVTKAFSPNGDQTNDYWTIENINTTGFSSNKFPIANVKIFNIQGQLIYAANQYKNDWDGTSSNGTRLPVGTYIYEVIFSKPEFKTQKGWMYIKY